MSEITLKDIIETKDIEIKTIEVPEWGGSICLKQMNGLEREEFEGILLGKADDKGKIKKTDKLRGTLLSLTLCNSTGVRVFKSVEEGVDTLSKKNAAVVSRLYDIAKEYNGLKDEEESRKN